MGGCFLSYMVSVYLGERHFFVDCILIVKRKIVGDKVLNEYEIITDDLTCVNTKKWYNLIWSKIRTLCMKLYLKHTKYSLGWRRCRSFHFQDGHKTSLDSKEANNICFTKRSFGRYCLMLLFIRYGNLSIT